MKYCTNCGRQLKQNEKFCSFCGKEAIEEKIIRNPKLLSAKKMFGLFLISFGIVVAIFGIKEIFSDEKNNNSEIMNDAEIYIAIVRNDFVMNFANVMSKEYPLVEISDLLNNYSVRNKYDKNSYVRVEKTDNSTNYYICLTIDNIGIPETEENNLLNTSVNEYTICESKTIISLKKYNKINVGMTYNEVKNIIGSDGKLLSESEILDIKTEVYYYYGVDGISNANFMFQNNKLISKSQVGLK